MRWVFRWMTLLLASDSNLTASDSGGGPSYLYDGLRTHQLHRSFGGEVGGGEGGMLGLWGC